MNTGNIYLHQILGNTLFNTVGIFIYIKCWGILYVEHCWTIYLPKIVGNTYVEHCSCWKIFLRKILGILYAEHWEDLFTQNTGKYWEYLC